MKDVKLIPEGIYCYTWESVPAKENEFRGKVNVCPYYGSKLIAGVKVPWCFYMERGGIDNNWKEQEWEAISKHYPDEYSMDSELSEFLLWDQVKSCGENEGEERFFEL